jgi:hypothetical protein
MSVYPGQGLCVGSFVGSSMLSGANSGPIGSGFTAAIPRVAADRRGPVGTLSPMVLLVPTFGNTDAGYQPGASDHQHASPAGLTGLARTSGSPDA